MKGGHIEGMDYKVLWILVVSSTFQIGRKLPHFILYISRLQVYSIQYTYSTQNAHAPTRADKKFMQYDNYTDRPYMLLDNQLYKAPKHRGPSTYSDILCPKTLRI